jgi:hypothetical protein
MYSNWVWGGGSEDIWIIVFYCVCIRTYQMFFLTIIEFVITFLTIIKFCGRKKKVGRCLIVQKQDIQVLFHLFLTNDTFDLLLPNPIG